jgi:hypothetical protein
MQRRFVYHRASIQKKRYNGETMQWIAHSAHERSKAMVILAVDIDIRLRKQSCHLGRAKTASSIEQRNGQLVGQASTLHKL